MACVEYGWPSLPARRSFRARHRARYSGQTDSFHMKTSARNAPWEEEPIVWHRYSTNLAGGQRGVSFGFWTASRVVRPKRFWSVGNGSGQKTMNGETERSYS